MMAITTSNSTSVNALRARCMTECPGKRTALSSRRSPRSCEFILTYRPRNQFKRLRKFVPVLRQRETIALRTRSQCADGWLRCRHCFEHRREHWAIELAVRPAEADSIHHKARPTLVGTSAQRNPEPLTETGGTIDPSRAILPRESWRIAEKLAGPPILT